MTYTDILNILLTPSVTFVIGILTVIISRNTNVSSIAMERLKFVYHPLFLSIEPFLYQKVTFEDVTPFLDKYNEIERNHSLLISPKLRHSIRV
ncbi:MAG: hypothetical protein PHS82_06375, partial [Lachnospiraceae bacterium]|nr:hypothetical protein [Lachnospiraceae bacterium]